MGQARYMSTLPVLIRCMTHSLFAVRPGLPLLSAECSSGTVTEALVLRPLLEDWGCITESIRILVPVDRKKQKCFQITMKRVRQMQQFQLHRQLVSCKYCQWAWLCSVVHCLRQITLAFDRQCSLPFVQIIQAVNHRKNPCAWMFKWVP